MASVVFLRRPRSCESCGAHRISPGRRLSLAYTVALGAVGSVSLGVDGHVLVLSAWCMMDHES
jgi:hypothetical protein